MGDHRKGFGVCFDALLAGDVLHAAHQLREFDRAEIELLAARSDGVGNLVRLGGAHHEDGPLGRFFQSLQQRIEALNRDLVSLIDDEDLVAIARRLVADVVAQLAHLIDAAIRGSVDFNHVDRIAGGDLEAAGADAARLDGGPLNAIQAARQNAGDGRLAGTALAGKDVAVGQPRAGDGVLKSGLDVFLTNQLAKRLRTIFPGDDLIHGKW